jgi:predicted nucleic acid-binding Zn ribbon protein
MSRTKGAKTKNRTPLSDDSCVVCGQPSPIGQYYCSNKCRRVATQLKENAAHFVEMAALGPVTCVCGKTVPRMARNQRTCCDPECMEMQRRYYSPSVVNRFGGEG